METFIILSAIPIMVYLIKTNKESTYGARMVTLLIILTSMGGLINLDKPIMGIQGFQPIHFFWAVTFMIVLHDFGSSRHLIDYPKFFTAPFVLFIIIYLTGIFVTATAWPSHSFFNEGFSLSNLILHQLIVPIQIVLTGWMVMVITAQKHENMVVIQKSIMFGAIILGLLIAHFYLQRGGMRGGWSTYNVGRLSLGSGFGITANSLAALTVYYCVACIVMTEHKAKILQPVSIGFSLMGIVFTFSRMAWYALASIIVLLVPRLKWSMRMLLAVLMLLIWQQMHTQIKNRLQYGKNKAEYSDDFEGKLDSLLAGRLTNIWQPAMRQIAENPIFGTGIGSRVNSEASGSSHNAYLGVLLDNGIFGLVIVIVLMSNFLVKFKGTKAPFFYAVIAMLVMGLVGHRFYPYRGNSLFFILYGMALVDWHNAALNSDKTPKKRVKRIITAKFNI